MLWLNAWNRLRIFRQMLVDFQESFTIENVIRFNPVESHIVRLSWAINCAICWYDTSHKLFVMYVYWIWRAAQSVITLESYIQNVFWMRSMYFGISLWKVPNRLFVFRSLISKMEQNKKKKKIYHEKFIAKSMR